MSGTTEAPEHPAPRRASPRGRRPQPVTEPNPYRYAPPVLTGRRFVVTGASAGLGLESAARLAERGADVVLAVRSEDRGGAARRFILDRVSALRVQPGTVDVELLDLANLNSVVDFAGRISDIDVLVCNAGVIKWPERRETTQGFELMLGTNFLGHFKLVSLLIEQLAKRTDARVVSLGSIAQRFGSIRFGDLQRERRYTGFSAYAQSKLACMLFGVELHNRLSRASMPVKSVIAHPGLTATSWATGDVAYGTADRAVTLRETLGFASPVSEGVGSQLFAAADPSVESGDLFGPDGFAQLVGAPERKTYPAILNRVPLRERLWQRANDLTDARWPRALSYSLTDPAV